MKNKQTAVEWLVETLNNKIDYIPIKYWDSLREIIQQAKAMELAQRIDDYNNGHIDRNNNRFKLPKLNQNETND